MNKQLIDYVRNNINEIIVEWRSSIIEVQSKDLLNFMHIHLDEKMSSEFGEIVIMQLTASKEVKSEAIHKFTKQLVRFSYPIHFVNQAVDTFARVTFEKLENDNIIMEDNVKEYLVIFMKWISPLRASIIEAYSSEWDRTANLQKVALQELSAPLIPIFDKISVMPLIGAVDTERAKFIIENLLEGVVKHRAEVVLLDITGVPVVDTMVAHHIIQAADAVRLVGAKCMLVGIRPEIAQTIVTLGIDLHDFTTTSTLRRGVKKALEFTNRKIVEVE